MRRPTESLDCREWGDFVVVVDYSDFAGCAKGRGCFDVDIIVFVA